MQKLLPLRIVTNGLIIIFSCVIIFHLLVITSLIPSDIVWGGNISDNSQMVVMELVSIAFNLFMLAVVCTYAGIIKMDVNPTLLKICFWVMFLLFLINTFGNLMSKSSLETYIFTPLTIVLTLFCFRIAAFGFNK